MRIYTLFLFLFLFQISYGQPFKKITVQANLLKQFGLGIDIPLKRKFSINTSCNIFHDPIIIKITNANVFLNLRKYFNKNDANRNNFYFFSTLRYAFKKMPYQQVHQNDWALGEFKGYCSGIGIGIKSRIIDIWIGGDYVFHETINFKKYDYFYPRDGFKLQEYPYLLNLGFAINFFNFQPKFLR